MIFDAYNFFKPIVDADLELHGIYQCSGFMNMEDVLRDIRKIKYPILMVEDAPDCNLAIGDSPRTAQHPSIYIIYDGGQNDSTKRAEAFRGAAAKGKELFLKMQTISREGEDIVERWDSSFNLNEENITMQRIGPTIQNGYGYSFMFSL